jgi:protein O-GlcNAc transferase
VGSNTQRLEESGGFARTESLRAEALKLVNAGSSELALEALKAAVESAPASFDCLRDLATLYGWSNDWEQATVLYERAYTLNPDDLTLLNDWCRALIEVGQAERCIALLSATSSEHRGSARAHYLLGRAYIAVGRIEDAIGALQTSIELDCNFAPARLLLAQEFGKYGFFFDARDELLQYLGLVPNDRRGRSDLVKALWHCGELKACISLCEALIEEGIATSMLEAFYRVALIHSDEESAASLRLKHEAWRPSDGQTGLPCPATVSRDIDPDRTLKIGFVGNQFAKGPFYHFVTPLLRDRNRNDFVVHCYHTSTHTDAFTDVLRPMADFWRHEPDLACAARLIEEDQIDILVDLSGHYGRHLSLFGQRRAPIQLALPTEYPSTTGIRGLDYLLTDRATCPAGQEAQYTEMPYFLEKGYMTYNPPEPIPIGPLPYLSRGVVTFGLFQRPAKMNDRVWTCIAEIMQKCRNSRLLIHYPASELDVEGSTARIHYSSIFEKHGIHRDRLDFRGSAPLTEHLQILAGVDIALDSFPYNGQTTTCECLWMGIPVVTMAGSTHVSCVGRNLLTQVGISELVANTEAEYVALAVDLGANVDALVDLRRRLRDKVVRSPMADGRAVSGIESAFRNMWRSWCEKQDNR